MKLAIFFSFILTFANAVAQIRINKGPVFQLSDIEKTSQSDLVKKYILFNAKNFLRNKSNSTSLKLDDAAYKDIKLTHSDPKLLSFGSFSYKDENGNYLSWDNVNLNYGLCNGFAMTSRQFAFYAKFSPYSPIPNEHSKTQADINSYYENLIDRVMSSQPTVIPGFMSLSHLSESIYATYLKKHIIDQWNLYTGSAKDMWHNIDYKIAYSNHYVLASTNYNSLDKLKKIYNDIKFYTDRNFYPKFYSAYVGVNFLAQQPGNPHVQLITKLASKNEPDETNPFIDLEVLNNGRLSTYKIGLDGQEHLSSDDYLHFLLAAKNQLLKNKNPLFNNNSDENVLSNKQNLLFKAVELNDIYFFTEENIKKLNNFDLMLKNNKDQNLLLMSLDKNHKAIFDLLLKEYANKDLLNQRSVNKILENIIKNKDSESYFNSLILVLSSNKLDAEFLQACDFLLQTRPEIYDLLVKISNYTEFVDLISDQMAVKALELFILSLNTNLETILSSVKPDFKNISINASQISRLTAKLNLSASKNKTCLISKEFIFVLKSVSEKLFLANTVHIGTDNLNETSYLLQDKNFNLFLQQTFIGCN